MNTGTDDARKQNVACLSVFSNLFLTVAKILTGVSIGSVSIISEGIHSGMDLLASCIAYFSVRKSAEPPDADHAFGHGKYEDASGLVEALLIVLAAGIIIWEACHKLISGGEMVSLDLLYAGMIVMGISAVMNFFVSQRLMKVAKETESIALESDAWHLRTDVLTSAGVFAGLVLIQITHLVFLDSVIAIIVALLILREAYSLIRRSFADLMDESLSEDEVILIKEIICRHANEFTNFHSLKTRRSGPNRFVEFHLMMPHATPLDAAHAVLKGIENELVAEMPRTSVIVHLDPCDGRCGRPECTFVCKVMGK
ncbi:cation diffusion facilitator family transporter [Methanocorpusculum sp. MG]|uniref:Cation diffusion facilitator family transporter n=1 Tax=Methanocorpusculum petauri TaxID=3002863 RepID=A0ABT4IEN2_9EURY|nr:cation diffusion facilitator family transporter [Methanocorpusculum petauri]MCZ0860196.1 cation diffusion facilitator family transporter [Methanocorpusculum petauri]